jgi:alpha-ribazole phosphatase
VTLWLVRHAQPCIAPGVCYGALDVPADAKATGQSAVTLAMALPSNARVITSPLQRCEQLAQALCGERPDLTYRTDARLVEMNFGEWEGVPWADIPRAALDAWTADFENHRFGGVESANEVLSRVAAVWRETQACMAGEGGTTIWITHAGVIRAHSMLTQGIEIVTQASQWPAKAPAFGEFVRYGDVASQPESAVVLPAK